MFKPNKAVHPISVFLLNGVLLETKKKIASFSYANVNRIYLNLKGK